MSPLDIGELLKALGDIARSLKAIETKMDASQQLYEAKDFEEAREAARLQKILIEKQVIDSFGIETLKLWKKGKTSWS